MISNYYPFGMAQAGRNWDGNGNYRYGYNGKEEDNEIKTNSGDNGKSLDYGARWYDSRKARWDAVDPLANVFPSQSPYSYAYNSPLIYIDEGGKYPYWLHFKMTYLALIQNGCDIETAREIAHYASVYADHPPAATGVGHLLGLTIYDYNKRQAESDNEARVKNGEQPIPYLLDYLEDDNNEINYDNLKDSQDPNLIMNGVVVHVMEAQWEDIGSESAINRGLYGGAIKEQNGISCDYQGAVNTVFSILGTNQNFSTLSRFEKINLGISFHAIQDNVVHKGAKWAEESWIVSPISTVYRNITQTSLCGSCNGHPDLKCTFGYDSDKAYFQTDQLIKQAKSEFVGPPIKPANE